MLRDRRHEDRRLSQDRKIKTPPEQNITMLIPATAYAVLHLRYAPNRVLSIARDDVLNMSAPKECQDRLTKGITLKLVQIAER